MENFNSIFELLAAFNFAYVLSDTFQNGVVHKVFGSFRDALKIYEKCEDSLKLIGIQKAEFKKSNKSIQDLANRRYKEAANLAPTIALNKNTILDKVNNFIDSRIFNLLCLNSALYCFCILLLAGFGWTSSDNTAEITMILIFNVIYATSVLFIAIRPTWYINITFYSVCWQFLFVLVASSVFNLFLQYHLEECKSISEKFYYINVVFGTLAGSANFIFAFIKGLSQNRKDGYHSLTKAKEIEAEVDKHVDFFKSLLNQNLNTSSGKAGNLPPANSDN
jgi:hypothetical protein